jgi:hypothetical protein
VQLRRWIRIQARDDIGEPDGKTRAAIIQVLGRYKDNVEVQAFLYWYFRREPDVSLQARIGQFVDVTL